ncbi:MAG: ABC transporter substrate-binding protein, partial [Bacilli bacterium]|nr:ABC transporter substrate-binding protein [Bacilli bacterium]
MEKGYFEEVGIKIDLILTPGADKVSAAVLSNDVEIGFAGAESAIYVYNEAESDYLQLFAGLTKRDGQFIVSRKENPNFELKDLIGKEILVGRQTGMPALNFLNALKNEGIDESKIKMNTSVE